MVDLCCVERRNVGPSADVRVDVIGQEVGKIDYFGLDCVPSLEMFVRYCGLLLV